MALVGALAVPALVMVSLGGATTAQAAPAKALILGPSVRANTAITPPTTRSLEEEQATNDGFAVTVVTGPQWAAMTAAQFATYQVIIIGDNTGGTAHYADAEANKAVWQPVVMSSGGNRIVIAGDPTNHHGAHPGATILEAKGIAYAGAASGATGVYITLSQAYASATPGTAVPILDGLSVHGTGQFTILGSNLNAAVLVATTPQTAGLNTANLVNWGNSVHGTFETWPSDWTPLAVATDSSAPKIYSAFEPGTTNKATGAPYILISLPATVKSNITLTPPTATHTVGGSTTVTATVVDDQGVPLAGITVRFYVEAGPNRGKSGTGLTGVNGVATFTYSGTGGVGTDTVSGVYNPPGSLTAVVPTPQEKNFAQVVWTAAVITSPSPSASPSPSPVGLPKAGSGGDPGGSAGTAPVLLILALSLVAMIFAAAWRVASPLRHWGRSD